MKCYMKEEKVKSRRVVDLLLSLSSAGKVQKPIHSMKSGNHVFECKTCSRQFPSFQALGGHRTSHKRAFGDRLAQIKTVKPKPDKAHECPICGVGFPMGQALGGHMRRHKPNMPRTSPEGCLEKKHSGAEKSLLLFDLNLTPWENALVMGTLALGFRSS